MKTEQEKSLFSAPKTSDPELVRHGLGLWAWIRHIPTPTPNESATHLKTANQSQWSLGTCPVWSFPPGGVAVYVGCRRVVGCCHPTLYNSHEHRHLAQLASPQFSLHFYVFYYFFLFSLLDYKKPPIHPIFPEVSYSYSPWAYFPPFLFYLHISSELVL